jgi:hypothetical protein
MAAAIATLSDRKSGLIGITNRASARDLGDASGFPSEQQDIVPRVAVIQIGTGSLGRNQDQPETPVVTPSLEF